MTNKEVRKAIYNAHHKTIIDKIAVFLRIYQVKYSRTVESKLTSTKQLKKYNERFNLYNPLTYIFLLVWSIVSIICYVIKTNFELVCEIIGSVVIEYNIVFRNKWYERNLDLINIHID